jgi:hypothetical protein
MMQPTHLKALAYRVLERNSGRNPNATGGDNQRNSEALFNSKKLRSVGPLEVRPELNVYEYRLSDAPNFWLTMIAPYTSIEDAERELIFRFGRDRLIAVRTK